MNERLAGFRTSSWKNVATAGLLATLASCTSSRQPSGPSASADGQHPPRTPASSPAACLPVATAHELDKPVEFPVEPDCNTPYFWTKKNGAPVMNVFVSSWDDENRLTKNFLLSGPNIHQLAPTPVDMGNAPKRNLHWIEGLYRKPNGQLVAWYHSEDGQACDEKLEHKPDGYAAKAKRVPAIGWISSDDGGKTFVDHGIIASAADGTIDCSKTDSVFFAGGIGDPFVAPDKNKEFFYLIYGQYSVDPQAKQGLTLARLPASSLDRQKTGSRSEWKKYVKGKWEGDGLGGPSTPLFPVEDEAHHSFLDKQPDGFWSPSIYFDHKTGYYVMVMARTKDRDMWGTEGTYISYNKNIADVGGWSVPQKLALHPRVLNWYPQLIHSDPNLPYTELNGTALLFERKKAEYRLELELPPGCQRPNP